MYCNWFLSGFTLLAVSIYLFYLWQPPPEWSVCRLRVVSRCESGHMAGQRLRCAAGNTGWGPVPGM